MDISFIKNDIENIVDKSNVIYNAPMEKYTTFRIGGLADIIVFPSTYKEISAVIELAKTNSIPYIVLGNGSNIVVSDDGIDGIVIRTCENLDSIKADQDMIVAAGGARLSKVANFVLENELSGMEFASGIPGSIGGAITMNAGAYGGSMNDIVYSVKVLDKNGTIMDISNDEMKFGYRESIVDKQDLIVLETTFKLKKSKKEDIKHLMDEYKKRRASKQPLEFPSAGSVFKRPQGQFAGSLIEQAGLKGYKIGGAQVSKKHGGFIINIGSATAKDVVKLIDYIKTQIKEKFDVELKPEVKFIGKNI